MSWNIYIYAEINKENRWEPLIENAVCDDFKNYDMDFYEELGCISIEEVSIPDVKHLAENTILPYNDVKWCTISSFFEHFYHVITEYETKLKSVYAALGTPLVDEDDDDLYLKFSSFNDDDEQNYKNQTEYWFKRMTLPINKELMEDLILSFNNAKKAYKMLGLLNVIEAIKPFNSNVRLLFVSM